MDASSLETVVVARRFRGPPESGNGGYCAGLAAQFIDGVGESTLRKPPPLDVPLQVERGDTIKLLHEGELIVEARPSAFELDVPSPPSFEAAQEATTSYISEEEHIFPGCFTCGPQRTPDDGLCIFPGPVAGGEMVAAPWIPHASVCDDSGQVLPLVLWAALDCPGFFAIAKPGDKAVLGRMAADVRGKASVRAGERCVAVAWPLGRDGRKLHAATAVFGASGQLAGLARQTWITL